MTKKTDTPEKPIVEGVDDNLLKGFLSLLTLRFIREDRADKLEEEEKKRNG